MAAFSADKEKQTERKKQKTYKSIGRSSSFGAECGHNFNATISAQTILDLQPVLVIVVIRSPPFPLPCPQVIRSV